MPEIHRRFPDLELLLVEEKTDVVLERLRDGRLDVGHPRPARPRRPSARRSPCSPRTSCWRCRPTTRWPTTDGPVDLSVLAGEHVLLLEEGHCLRDQALAVCQLAGAAERTGFRATSLETLRQMVAAGVGITLLPELAVQPPVPPSADIRLLRFADPGPDRAIAMFWRDTNVYRDFFPKLVEVVRAQVNALVGGSARTAHD